MSTARTDFFSTIPPQARVLVLDLGFLGDTIHLIPALAAIRQALPRARLEVMVAEHIKSILAVCPWLDAVHGYPRFPKGPRWYEDFGRVRALRAGEYEVVINLNSTDRASILTGLSGAALRLGRVRPRAPIFWSWCFTQVVEVPYETQPVYLQHLATLKAANFPQTGGRPGFPIIIPEETRRHVEARLGQAPPYIHVSPFSTLDEKELPAPVLAEFLNAAHAARPDLGLVISTAPNQREQNKLAALRPLLRFEPWRIFSGNLSLVELAEVIRRSRLHLGGDSGALHVALMTGVPTLSWWRDYPGRVAWQPQGPGHFSVMLGKNHAGGVVADPTEIMQGFTAAINGRPADTA